MLRAVKPGWRRRRFKAQVGANIRPPDNATNASKAKNVIIDQNGEVSVPSELEGIVHDGEDSMTSLVLEQPDHPEIAELTFSERHFTIRSASNAGQRTFASMLINKMYSSRGYGPSELPATPNPNRITLIASEDGQVRGTLTLGLDSQHGLLADEIYRDEIDQVRAQKRQVCELSKLAVDNKTGSKYVLAALFHIAYIYGRALNQVTDVFIEVNPRHAPFYRRFLGFVRIGEERMCLRVNAPAVLLRLELSYVDDQIEKFGGRLDLASSQRSLYPYFFSKEEETGIAGRLLRLG